MRNQLLATVALAAAIAIVATVTAGIGKAQQPGSAVPEPFTVPIGNPTGPAAPAYLPTTPGYQRLPAPVQQPTGIEMYTSPSKTGGLRPSDPDPEKSHVLHEYLSEQIDVSINNDIAVNDKCGEWLICLSCYSGKEAPVLARTMALELRNNPDYKINAYVYTTGVKEREADVERIRNSIKQQQEINALSGTPDKPVRVPVMRCEIQCTVLVGGYRDMATARNELEKIKRFKELDYRKIRVQTVTVPATNGPSGTKPGESLPGEYRALNPFLHGMVIRNPTLASARANGVSAEDIALMKILNEKEPLSLLNCPKKYTLAIRQVPLGIYRVDKQPNSSGLFTMPSFFGSGNKDDQAEKITSNLASEFRSKYKLEAYVLHTKFCSYVTIGSYDRVDDPQLLQDQQRLQQLSATVPQLGLAPQAKVMEIPH